jgi:hypothetical protein
LGQTAWGLTTADFNNDGNMDFAVASATSPFTNSTISLFYNNGGGGFTKQDIFTFTEYIDSLASGDFNNDGYIDILFSYSECKPGESHYIYGIVSILFNDGNNNFGNATMIVRQTSGEKEAFGRINPHISSADYNMDGNLDFLVGDNSGKVELYVNNGLGNFTSAEVIYDWGHISWGITSADFDGDGSIDFLVSAEGNGRPYGGYIYLKQNQKIHDNSSICFDNSPGEIIAHSGVVSGSLAPLNYDNDGDMDFIAGSFNSLYLYIYDQGLYFPCYIGALPDSREGQPDDLTFGAVATADFNNDGYNDFVVGGVQGVIRLFTNNQGHPFSAVIVKPQIKHLNIFDKDLQFPLMKRTIILGKITIEVKTLGDAQKVEFYVDGTLKYRDTIAPYEWLWETPSFGKHEIQIIAYNSSGNIGYDTINVWRFLTI